MKRLVFSIILTMLAFNLFSKVMPDFVDSKTHSGQPFCVWENNLNTISLNMVLVKNANCYDTQTGLIKLEVTGIPNKLYVVKYAILPVSIAELYTTYPFDNQNFLALLKWQESNSFDVKSGVWVGYVKAYPISDPSSISYQGHWINENGQRVLNHRIFVSQPAQIQASIFDKYSFAASSSTARDGAIKISALSGGYGGPYTAFVLVSSNGNTTTYTWQNVKAGDILSGIYTSTSSTNIADSSNLDSHKVFFLESHDGYDCVSPKYNVVVLTKLNTAKDEFSNNIEFECFIIPNPNKGQFSLKFGSKYLTNATINLININGIIIEKRELQFVEANQSLNFNISNLSKGVYFMVIKSDNGIYSKKMFLL